MDGMNGLLVPERRPELIGQAIARVLNDRALARALGERGRTLVVDNWTWEKTVECVENSLEEVVARGLSASESRSERP